MIGQRDTSADQAIRTDHDSQKRSSKPAVLALV